MANINSFDLDAYEDTASADVVIKDPSTGAPSAAVITLAGPEHPSRKKIEFDRQRRMRAVLQKTGKLKLQDPEDDEADETDMLVACTLGWSGITISGKDVPFTTQAARDLYGDPKRRWLRAQVSTALGERDSFIKRSAAT